METLFVFMVIIGLVLSKQVHHSANDLLGGDTRNTALWDEIKQIQETQKMHKKTLIGQNEVIDHLTNTVRQQEQEIRLLKEAQHNYGNQNGGAALYQYQEYGCTFDTIQLSCPSGGRITVNSAYYGQYVTACEAGCCVPHPTDDCQELMADNSSQDWDVLKSECDNETSCAFQNPGTMLETCLEPYDSHYLIVNFKCSQEVSVVGFAAYPAEKRTYNDGDQILFDSVITNTGGYYDSSLSRFICPVSGLYLFSLTLYTGVEEKTTAYIKQQDVNIGRAYADYEDNVQGSLSIVVECYENQQIWVESYSDNNVLNNSLMSMFTGALLNSYN